MHEYIKTRINEEIWVVMELLMQKSVRCIAYCREEGVVACDIFLIRGPAICDSL